MSTSFSGEIRTAVRSLVRTPTVAASAVLCLALGIGATTAISSAISRALLQPLPFRDPDQLVAVHRITPHSGPQGTWPHSVANYTDLARQATQVRPLAAISQGTALVSLPSESVQARQLHVTGNLFELLGANVARGRLIGFDDDRPDRPLVAVLSDEFWRTSMGGDPSVIGRSFNVDGEATTVVGILPPDFRIPHGGNVLRADVWMPIRFTPQQLAQRRSNFLLVLGRLAPNATVQRAESDLRGHFSSLIATYPELRGDNVRVAPLQAENLQSIRKPLLLLFGAVCMVLLIASTNVAALLLARGVQRRREMAVRVALGASRWDAMRPALIESFVITTAGVILGLALATGGVRTIGSLAAARMQQLAGLHVDLRVIAFSLTLAVIVAIVCGAVPALRSASVDPQDALRGGRGGGSGRDHHRALRTLVVLEISLSLVLLIGAGLVLKAFTGLLRIDPGFETAHVLTLNVTTSATRYPNQTSVRSFLEPALAALRSVPGVEAAGAISAVPYVTWGNNSNTRYEGQPGEDPALMPIVEQRVITPEFFAVTKQRLIAGRLLGPGDDDRPGAPAVVVVNEALGKRDFKGRDPIGQRFHTSDTTFATIVGVVSDIRNMGPIAEPQPEMYWAYRQGASGSTFFPLMIRTKGDPSAVSAAAIKAIRAIDPTVAVGDVQPMTDVIARSLGRPRFYFSLLGSFAAVAILLAVAGLYGVLSYTVAQRTRELGIRAALGSPRSQLLRLVALEGVRLVAIGLVLGFLGGAAVTRLMAFMLYGVSPLDFVAWLMSGMVMLTAALLATLVPARRAARADPVVAMRND
jgi:putative ABC transport system permease protein